MNTNDEFQPVQQLLLKGQIEAAAKIVPLSARLIGKAGEDITAEVRIIPHPKNPFVIKEVKSDNEGFVSVQLKEVPAHNGNEYVLTIRNLEKMPINYFDVIRLETDSTIKPMLNVRVYGLIR